jgi:hypothetical protein
MIHTLIASISELLDENIKTSLGALDYLSRCCTAKRDALDELNRRGLSGNPIYSEIERKVSFPSANREDSSEVRGLIFRYCSPSLQFLKGRLELAAQLRKREQRRGHERKTSKEIEREKKIFAVIKKGLTGRRYCVVVENEGIKPRQRWIEEGCPASYADAYSLPKWRKRIQNEKNKIAQRYSPQLPNGE